MTDTSSILSLITKIDCAACVVIFLWATLKLLSRKRNVSDDIFYIENGKDDKPNKTKELLDGFKATCKDKEYTSEYASDYINLDTVAAAYGINLKRMSVIPNILTSLGILGTFLGLSIAVAGFDSTSADGIQSSIKTLLEGMGTAFYTSVAGMACSLFFLLIERGNINRLTNDIDSFCDKLDKKYHCSADYALIRSFSYEDEEGNVFSPSETLQMVQEDVKNMRKQLETFGTDICDNIGNAMDTSFQDKLVPIINELAAKLENPAQAVTDGLIQELKNVCDDFSNNVTKGVNDKMDELLERFIDASNSILTLPDTVDGINKSLSASTKDTVLATQAVSEALDNQILRLNDLADSFVETLGKMSDVSANITELHTKLESLPQTVSEASTAIALSAAEIKASQENVGEALDYIKTVNDNTSKTVEQYTENIEKIQSGLSDIFGEITEGLTQYSDTVKKSLQDMLNPFTSSVTEATEKVANAIAPLNDAVTDLGGFNDTVRKVLGEVEASFKPVESVLKQLAEIKQKAIEEVRNSETNQE